MFRNKGTSLLNIAPNSGLNRKILQLHVDHCKCCQFRWTLSVINWWWSSVNSLSHWASIFVYNTMGVRQRVAWVCLRQLILAVFNKKQHTEVQISKIQMYWVKSGNLQICTALSVRYSSVKCSGMFNSNNRFTFFLRMSFSV